MRIESASLSCSNPLVLASLVASQDETGEAKNRQVMRRRSYDSTLFGLDVFEGLEMDFKARLEREHLHPILRYIPVIDPAWQFQQNRDLISGEFRVPGAFAS